MVRQVKVNKSVVFGGKNPLVLIAGPCVIESPHGTLKIAEAIKKITIHTHEACLQLWGRGGDRQVAGARTCVVVNGGYGYGAMLLRRD